MNTTLFNKITIIASIALTILLILVLFAFTNAHSQVANYSVPALTAGIQVGSANSTVAINPTSADVSALRTPSASRYNGSLFITATWPDLLEMTYTFTLPRRSITILSVSDTTQHDVILLGMKAEKDNILNVETTVRSHRLELLATRLASSPTLTPIPLGMLTPRVEMAPLVSVEYLGLKAESTVKNQQATSTTINQHGEAVYSGLLGGIGLSPRVTFLGNSLSARGEYQLGKLFKGNRFDIKFVSRLGRHGSAGVGYRWRDGKVSVGEAGVDFDVKDSGAYVEGAVVF